MLRHFDNSLALVSSPEMNDLAKKVLSSIRGKNNHYTHIPASYQSFSDGEFCPKITATVRSKDVYFFHSFESDPNIGLMKLFLTNNAIKLASAKSLILVLPFLPYMRQDRKHESRVSISARVLADLVETCDIFRRMITMDMHVEQEVGFFRKPVDDIPGRILHVEYFKKKYNGNFKNVVVVAPDFGGSTRAYRFAQKLGENIDVGVIQKKRRGAVVEVTGYIGNRPLAGADVILYDDIIGSGGTTIQGIHEIRRMRAKSVTAVATHGILSPTAESTAEEKLQKAGVQVVITESIPRSKDYYQKHSSWLTSLPIHTLLAKVIEASERRDGSVSSLF